jgi:hypothetical protein
MPDTPYSLAHVSITYDQRIGARYESLTISAEDDGGGHYLILKTTTGWSIDSPDELLQLLADFQRRVPEVNEPTSGEVSRPGRPSLPLGYEHRPTTEQPPF